MADLTALETRLRSLLDDPASLRFSSTLLATAFSHALTEINHRQPRLMDSEFTVTLPGREQALSGLNECFYLLHLARLDETSHQKLEPETCFTYQLLGGIPVLHFRSEYIPQAGDRFTVCYASAHTLAGLDGASLTTLPAELENALVEGAAGQACALRAGSLLEAYGSRGEECAALLKLADYWHSVFLRSLAGLRVIQEFGFPPGFVLDPWESRRIE
ncbi:MAG TPA: hypothetical protein PLV27_02575 [Anaerolineaceae bacterium]|nr:hypothetical protein [Anaerolineaceae bacterium]